ncbi:hypothetical protein GCM10010495_05040 [Kitasatospora herbaricolor]|nr:hypothetical protein GCM10010495_05040 [Kitasatospora herbaricolor]
MGRRTAEPDQADPAPLPRDRPQPDLPAMLHPCLTLLARPRRRGGETLSDQDERQGGHPGEQEGGQGRWEQLDGNDNGHQCRLWIFVRSAVHFGCGAARPHR